MKIISQVENKLMNRTEITASITFDGKTPNRDEVKKELKQKGHVIVRKINPVYGESSAIIEAVVYKKESDAKIESKRVLEKNQKKEEPKEETTAEAPAKEVEKTESSGEEKPSSENSSESVKSE